LSNAEWAALSVSNVIWPVVYTAGIQKVALYLWKEVCSFGNDKATDYRCNRSKRGSLGFLHHVETNCGAQPSLNV